VLVGDQSHAPGARHERDLAEIDAATDDDQPHAEAEDAENRNAADEAENVPCRRKTGKSNREDDQQNDNDCRDDLFLAEPVEVAPPRCLLAGRGGCDGSHVAVLLGKAGAINEWRRT